MSFTSIIKEELSQIEFPKIENITELSAIIQCSQINKNTILITTENNTIARKIYKLIKEIFNINPKITVRRGYNYNKKMIYLLEITKNTKTIIKNLGITKEIPEEFIIADESLIKAYIRGIFYMTGSINDPKKSRYHLELNLNNQNLAKLINEILNKYNLNSKILHRDNKYMVYIKEAEKISDFLRILGVSKALLYYEDIRIYRDHKNMTNRLNNCEQANVDRTIETASNQVKDINLIKETYGLDFLKEKEQIVATYRLKYPDASLLELSNIISHETETKITKSGIYHRLHKIKEIANKIKNSQNVK